jgi:hypothetical protein
MTTTKETVMAEAEAMAIAVETAAMRTMCASTTATTAESSSSTRRGASVFRPCSWPPTSFGVNCDHHSIPHRYVWDAMGNGASSGIAAAASAASDSDLETALSKLSPDAHERLTKALATVKPAAPEPVAATPAPAPKAAVSLPPDASKDDVCKTLGLAADEYDELKRDFDEMDCDKNGAVDMKEVKVSLTKERGGKTPSEDDVKGMMKLLDQDDDGKVTFIEYVTALAS